MQMRVYTYTYTYVCIYKEIDYTQVHIHTSMQVCVYIYIYIYIYMHITHTYTHTHTMWKRVNNFWIRISTQDCQTSYRCSWPQNLHRAPQNQQDGQNTSNNMDNQQHENFVLIQGFSRMHWKLLVQAWFGEFLNRQPNCECIHI